MQTCYATNINIREGLSTRTKEQRAALLVKANVLDTNGDYVKRFFSSETIKKDNIRRKGK